MALAWSIVGLIAVIILVTAFWVKIGPSVLVPHDGTRAYTKASWRKVTRPFIAVMVVVAAMCILILVGVLG